MNQIQYIFADFSKHLRRVRLKEIIVFCLTSTPSQDILSLFYLPSLTNKYEVGLSELAKTKSVNMQPHLMHGTYFEPWNEELLNLNL